MIKQTRVSESARNQTRRANRTTRLRASCKMWLGRPPKIRPAAAAFSHTNLNALLLVANWPLLGVCPTRRGASLPVACDLRAQAVVQWRHDVDVSISQPAALVHNSSQQCFRGGHAHLAQSPPPPLAPPPANKCPFRLPGLSPAAANLEAARCGSGGGVGRLTGLSLSSKQLPPPLLAKRIGMNLRHENETDTTSCRQESGRR